MKKRTGKRAVSVIVLLLFLLSAGLVYFYFNDISLFFNKLFYPDMQEQMQTQYGITLKNRYGRSLLNENQQTLYDEIYDSINNYKDILKISSTDQKVVQNVVNHYKVDTAEHFWLDNVTYILQNGKVIRIEFSYNRDKDKIESDRKLVEEKAANILKQFNNADSGYIKSKMVHDYIAENTKYQISKNDDIYNIYGVLINQKAVCEGYAKTYQYLMGQLGVESTYVKGTSRGENHGWNLVNLDGKYYHVDVTWDDIDTNKYVFTDYTYFHLTDEEIQKDHNIDKTKNILLPNAQDDTLNYYVTRSLMLDNPFEQKDQISEGMETNINEGKYYISVKVSNPTQYKKLLNDGQFIYTLMRAELKKREPYKTLGKSYGYINNDAQQTVTYVFKVS